MPYTSVIMAHVAPRNDQSEPTDDRAGKRARLELRSTDQQKAVIERAASILGESVTSFVLSTVLRDARRVIRDHSVTDLSVEDWTRFSTLLTADQEPSDALTQAARRYGSGVETSDGL